MFAGQRQNGGDIPQVCSSGQISKGCEEHGWGHSETGKII